MSDDAQYYLAESQYYYAINSVYNKVNERLQEASQYAVQLKSKYPKSEYLTEADELLALIEAAQVNNNIVQAQ